jgi:hypothetical protein
MQILVLVVCMVKRDVFMDGKIFSLFSNPYNPIICSRGHPTWIPTFHCYVGHHRHHTERACPSDGRRKCEYETNVLNHG